MNTYVFLSAETPADLDAISKWLDIAGNKLDYRRYGEVFTFGSYIFDHQLKTTQIRRGLELSSDFYLF